MRRYLTALVALLAIAIALAPGQRLMATGPTTVVVSPGTLVSPSSPTGWYFWNDKDDLPTGSPGELVSGPVAPPAGAGSVRLGPLTDNGATAAGHSVIATNAYFGTALANFTALSYSTYQPGPTLAVALQFDVRYRTTDTAYGGRLVFEPYQNGAVTVGSGWQSWSPLAGTWWASKTTAAGTGGAQVVPLPAGNCAQATPCTWSEINAAFPAAVVYGRLLLKAGSNWLGFDGNADSLTVGVSGSDTLYDFEPNCSTDCYVRADGNDANTGLADTPGDAKQTIQAAIAQVSAGGTVHVASGTYVETGQIVINKNLTITGNTVTKPIVKPAQNTGGSGDARGWILINSGITANLDHLVLDGTGFNVYQAIRSNGAGTIDRVDFQNIKYAQYVGLGVAMFGNMTVSNSTFSNIERIGVIAFGSGVTSAIIDGNTYTGKGAGDWLDYGIELGGGAKATLTNNTITNNTGVALVDSSTSAGVLVTTYFGGGTEATLTGNTIGGSTAAVAVGYDGADTSTVVAHQNDFSGNASGITTTAPAVNATDNWWGSANGPAHASNAFNVGSQGVPVDTGVSFVPWLDAPPPTGVSFAPVTTTSPVGSYASIQAGVNASSSGGTVNAKAGTFTENVTVTSEVTVAGAGQASTFVRPAVSAPNPCAGSSLCGGLASNVFLVQANNVTIHDLTADGDNPMLTSTLVVGGADLDARNGIITNHAAGLFNNLTVHHVTVKNIYLRGMYASSGGTFNLHHNTVQNVQAEGASIGMFNWVGAGVMSDNNVSDTNDAIAANHSSGTQFLNNTVTNSGSGVHTDNAGDGGGVADLLDGNIVSNCAPGGYGVWTFVPYIQPTVKRNIVTNCAVGLTTTGSYVGVGTLFQDNEVDGMGLAGSTGVYVTTSTWYWASANVSATFTGNIIKNNTDGFYLEAESGFTLTLDNLGNSISGNTGTGVQLPGTGIHNVKMTGDWWGTDTGPTHALNIGGTGDSVPDGVAYSPWLGIGTDASADPGFQRSSPMTWIANPDGCSVTCIQAAIDFSANGDTVKAKTGVFNEHVTVNKDITLTAASNPIIDGGGAGDGITVTVSGVTISLFEVRNVANGIVIASGANSATISNNNIHDFSSAGLRGTSASGASIGTNQITGPHTGSCVGGFWGILLQDVSGAVSGNTVTGIGNGMTTGCQEGRGIEAKGAGTLAITANNISQYQKSGIIVRDTLNTTISGNTTAGEGATSAIAQNGITVTSTGTTAITGNHMSGSWDTDVAWVSCGILTFNTATITGNDSTSDEVGICAIGGTGSQVTNNSIIKHRQQGIMVDGAAAILVDNNNIDGQGEGTTATPGIDPDTDVRYYGIFAVDSTGTLSNNVIKGIKHGVGSGLQSGVGIRLTVRGAPTPGTSNMTLNANNISDIQKGAIVVTNPYGGTAVHANVTNNTVAGNGPVAYIAQNGIQISYGSTAVVTGNNVSGYDYSPSTWSAAGILIYQAGATTVSNNNVHDNMEGLLTEATDNMIVSGNAFTNTRDAAIIAWGGSDNGSYTGNTVLGLATSTGMYIADNSTNNAINGNAFRNNDTGVAIDYAWAGAPTGNTFSLNCIAGNTTAGMATLGTQVGGPISAENNWWGKVDGPNPPGHGDVLNSAATIDAVPFLTATVAGCPVPLDGDGDGLNDPADNCPSVYNPTQANRNAEIIPLPKPLPPFDDFTNIIGDNVGDACESDIDHDGVPNTTETALGLSPFVSDTDGDRANDGAEIACGSDPLNPLSKLTGTDTDHDSLPDACEVIYGTNPAAIDSDSDKLLDGWEVRYWLSNPLVKNSDADGCTDDREVASMNNDFKVNSTDMLMQAQHFGSITPDWNDLDMNGDGKINSTDMLFTAQRYGYCAPS